MSRSGGSWRAALAGRALVPAPAPGCLTAAARPVEVVAPLDSELAGVGPPLLLAFHHRADEATGFRLLVGPSAATAEPVGALATVKGEGDVAVPVALGEGDAVFVEVRGPGRLCVEDARLTRPD